MTMVTTARMSHSTTHTHEIECPFCNFHDPYPSIIQEHIAALHPEPTPSSSTTTSRSRPYALSSTDSKRTRTASPNDSSGSEGSMFSICEVEGCGEPIMKDEMQSHMDLHYAEMVAMEQFEGNPQDGGNGQREKGREVRRHKEGSGVRHTHGHGERHAERREDRHGKRREKRAPGERARRLGKSELGPYADESQMPTKLRRQLEEPGKLTYRTTISPTGTLIKTPQISNETPNLIFTMSLLCSADQNVSQAWLCHPGVRHVGKQGKEGGFCGYRNIQMLISYLQAVSPPDTHPFGDGSKGVPTIIKLQDWIEDGWDAGINTNGRIETGGIRGTRKYIGTSEAQTLFAHHRIPCTALPFPSSAPGSLNTQLNLLDTIEAYFKSSIPATTPKAKIYVTPRPPIYYQQRGHSMTIVGCERTKDGWQNLLVFDPVFTPSPAIRSLEGRNELPRGTKPEVLLKAYRRGLAHLGKFREFELLRLDVGEGVGVQNGHAMNVHGLNVHGQNGQHHQQGGQGGQGFQGKGRTLGGGSGEAQGR